MSTPSVSFLYSITPPAAVAGTSAPTTLEDSGFKDLALDISTWDLELPPRLITGADMIAQRIGIRFKFWLGEWFLDTREGVPYIEQVLVANPDLSLIRALFRRVITSTPGVKRVESLDLSFDRAARTLVVGSFRATLIDGSTLALESPFIVWQKD